MLSIQSELTGKTAVYGKIRQSFADVGFSLGGDWDYDQGFFDSLLWQKGGTSYYVRIPVQVVSGHLDNDDAVVQFGEPFVIKHVVNTDEDLGLGPLFNASVVGGLFNQFQTPEDPDDYIENPEQWKQKAREALQQVERLV